MDADEYYRSASSPLDETLDLVGELQSTLGDINGQIAALGREAAKMAVRQSDLRSPNGEYLMTPLLIAKANVLLAITQIHN